MFSDLRHALFEDIRKIARVSLSQRVEFHIFSKNLNQDFSKYKLTLLILGVINIDKGE